MRFIDVFDDDRAWRLATSLGLLLTLLATVLVSLYGTLSLSLCAAVILGAAVLGNFSGFAIVFVRRSHRRTPANVAGLARIYRLHDRHDAA